jgi:hypothetical protein
LEVASISMLQQDLEMAATAPCPLAISVQLADIARLEDGWLDGEGAAYAPHVLARAREVFESLLSLGGIAMPYVYPTPEGEFRAEWNHPDRDVVVTLNAPGRRLRLLAVESVGNIPTRRESFDADQAGVKMLASTLEALLKAEVGP